MSCMASPIKFSIRSDESPSCSLLFLTLWLRARPHQSLTFGSEFFISSIDDFLGGNEDKLLLCPIRALRRYLLLMEQYHREISNFFV